ncbi:MAG: hypothetical protein HN509_13300 [Halobacteriovoraceae bacterium]|jgi:hypothetical protein|nr:hypothetical protein [Halobacteriovoraceae bacterium]MBT5094564.1 hypothetical protein [Halobacteriovoraceae bacterium]
MKTNFVILILALLSACGGSKSGDRVEDSSGLLISKNQVFFEKFGEVQPVQKSEIKKETLLKCTYVIERADSCTLQELPLLGMNSKKITVDRIIGRTMVSHRFLGENFKAALLKMSSEYLMQLFGSVGIIVISDKVNPSFYNSRSGTIFISARYLWTTPEQKKLATVKKDDRVVTGSGPKKAPLKFEFYGLQVVDKKNIWSASRDSSRTVEELKLPLYRLLVHELAHANDYLPSSFYQNLGIDSYRKIGELTLRRFKRFDLISDSLLEPLERESFMARLQKAINSSEGELFGQLLEMTAELAGELFSNESAVDPYGHYTQNEDLAMLVEDLLGLHDYQIERIQGVISYPSLNFLIPEDYNYPLAWGQNNRILEPTVLGRAMEAASQLFPSFNAVEFKSSLQGFKLIQAEKGMGWREFRAL